MLCGYTATPDSDKTARTTMGAHEYVKWSTYQRVEDALTELKEKGIAVYALETVEEAVNIYDQPFPKGGCALLLGNERYGIEANVLSLCDGIVSIPCRGVKNSLNVGVAFGIATFEITRQWTE
eukprot:TRINITY_DN5571_c0_g1_i1.p1 TRINITY_DN5571_c0_g1~~TRINITY_DN5571_c0_g1_i1.p1  ORF type:complete len:123 (+),score=22.38 TRINITY_DN5571_c0_g1_i1:611-979(+)